jgi:pyridoxamine 5'-phosphate oxidase
MHGDPYELFNFWYLPHISTGGENSNAVVLSTSSRNGRVSSRVVLLKYHDSDGFVFFTNYKSTKGIQLEENHSASLLFYWPDKSRQIRIEGRAEKTGRDESDNYFNSRNHGHKINAIISEQSKPVDDLNLFKQKMASATDYYKSRTPERPSYWGGFRLVPDRFEFWEEGENRFHRRQEFLYEGEKWIKRILYP